MRWPWNRSNSTQDQWVVAWCDQALTYVNARQLPDGRFAIGKMGVLRQGVDSQEAFARRVQAVGLKDVEVKVMLWPEQYQFLQIEAPAVPAEELRSAVRYQIRDMVETHVDDLTLDVMRVGDGSHKGAGHVFVVVATKAVLRQVTELGEALDWAVPVIDIRETAQRNLQNALAQQEASLDRAMATLVLTPNHPAVLTICANEELFYTRRLELAAEFWDQEWGQQSESYEQQDDGFSPVEEYVPGYATSAYGGAAGGDPGQRLLVEVQRSLDAWDRTWAALPLDSIRVFAGARTDELARWLGRELGQPVRALDVQPLFAGLEKIEPPELLMCWPLLGLLLRADGRR